MRNKIFVVGIDGATWKIIDPLIQKGYLPNIAKLIREGVSGSLISTVPSATVPAWPSFMTGKNPGKHGVFDFMTYASGEYYGKIMSSLDLRSETLWDLLSKGEKRSIVINVPLTYPPKKLNGIMISGMLTPPGGKYTYPQEVCDEIEKVTEDYIIEYDMPIKGRKNLSPEDALRKLKDMAEKRKMTALYLLRNFRWDFFIVVFRGTDIIQHEFWWNKNLILRYYIKIDSIIEELLASIERDKTIVFVISDHGFGPLRNFFNINKWLNELGLLKFKVIKKDQDRTSRMNNLLSRKKASKASLMTLEILIKWLFKLRLTKVIEFLPIRVKNKISNVDIDWLNTKAFSPSFFTTETNSIRINLEGREPKGIVKPSREYEELKNLIFSKLKILKDPNTQKRIMKVVYKREDIYHGPYINEAPDILYILKPGYKTALGFFPRKIVSKCLKYIGGCHQPDGIIIVNGPSIKKGVKNQIASIIDLAPTFLHILGLAIPREMDGRVLKEIFEEESELAKKKIVYQEFKEEKQRIEESLIELKVHARKEPFTEESEEIVRERLRRLGYL